MIEEIKVIENKKFLSSEDVNLLYSVVSSQEFPYYFHPKTSIETQYKNQCLDTEIYDDPFFVHSLYRNYSPNSEYFNILMSPFFNFCEIENINIKSILRAKINLAVPIGHDKLSSPHVDFTFNHNVFIYYFNTSDGDTILYEEKYDGGYKENLNILSKVPPEAGKGIAFNGLRYHSPSVPVQSSHRIILNVAFL